MFEIKTHSRMPDLRTAEEAAPGIYQQPAVLHENEPASQRAHAGLFSSGINPNTVAKSVSGAGRQTSSSTRSRGKGCFMPVPDHIERA